jgi:hypothetical protein
VTMDPTAILCVLVALTGVVAGMWLERQRAAHVVAREKLRRAEGRRRRPARRR